MASFQSAIRKLAEAAAERQREGIVYNIQQEVTPPPEFSTFDEMHKIRR